MFVVDASVWVSRFLRTDRFHAASTTWLADRILRGDSLFSPSLLPELAGALSRRSGRPRQGHEAVAAVERTPGVDLRSLDEHLIRLATQVASDLRLRGADAIYYALARELQAPLVTWDGEFTERRDIDVSVLTPFDAR
ncbi:MAG: type II toxin-antitoxin system VapC family toxin [Chloroflexi bacterium]|nr:type II toxin-antitoxin system VapC family toxin [Chloroflexota bacterium]